MTTNSLNRHPQPPLPSRPTQIFLPLPESTHRSNIVSVPICLKGSHGELDLLQSRADEGWRWCRSAALELDGAGIKPLSSKSRRRLEKSPSCSTADRRPASTSAQCHRSKLSPPPPAKCLAIWLGEFYFCYLYVLLLFVNQIQHREMHNVDEEVEGVYLRSLLIVRGRKRRWWLLNGHDNNLE
jgi:hypothetical protein